MMGEQSGKGEEFPTLEHYSFEVEGQDGILLKDRLYQAGVSYSDEGYSLVDDMLLSQYPFKMEHIETVKFHLYDVGINQSVRGADGWEKIVQAVQNNGIPPCPQFTAPEMARRNAAIIGKRVFIYSKPFVDFRGRSRIFQLQQDHGKLWLSGPEVKHRVWNPQDLFIGLQSLTT